VACNCDVARQDFGPRARKDRRRGGEGLWAQTALRGMWYSVELLDFGCSLSALPTHIFESSPQRREMSLHSVARVDRASSLPDLPAEIWVNVLRCLLIKRPEEEDGDATVVISPLSDWTGRDSSDNRLSSQVLGTNRALYTAGVEILYSQNSFEMNGDDVWVLPNFLSGIGSSNVGRMRHLRLDHRNAGYNDCRGSPHRHDQDVVYIDGWLRDIWVDRLFENFSALQGLETLSIAVDLPSKKMHDAVARMEIGLYVEESGLKDQLRAAVTMGDTLQYKQLIDQVLLYINNLGILRAAISLDQWFPGLNANV